MTGEQKLPHGVIAATWWNELQPDGKKRAGDRAALARLRRCGRPEEAAEVPAALALARRLGIRDGSDWKHLEAILVTAIVLAHVRANRDDVLTARLLGPAEPGGHAALSPLRLARLLAAETAEERIIAFRRAVALAGYTANVADLADALLNWSDRKRVAWAFAYHNVTPPESGAATAGATRVTGGMS
jgi:CRISPR system Cascade subunit CasB